MRNKFESGVLLVIFALLLCVFYGSLIYLGMNFKEVYFGN